MESFFYLAKNDLYIKEMKTTDDIILLGDPRLYEQCSPVESHELTKAKQWMYDLHYVLFDFRKKNGFGRGIAAPQLGIMKQLVYINTGEPFVLINPTIVEKSDVTFELWDDCMSIPNLLVKVKRHEKITVNYRDLDWIKHKRNITDHGLSELLQHEIDHLKGILCTMRAIDNKSFRINKRK